MGFSIGGPGTTIRFDVDAERVFVRTSRRSIIKDLEECSETELVNTSVSRNGKITRGVWALPFESVCNVFADGEWTSSFEDLDGAEVVLEIFDEEERREAETRDEQFD